MSIFVTLRIISYSVLAWIAALVVVLPFVTFAAECDPTSPGALCNPLAFESFQEFIARILRVLVMLSLPILALFMVYSGYLFVSARGNQGKLTDAKKNFVYIVIGTAIILGAWVIATLLGATVIQVVSGS